jgi:hypothetical protein
MSGKGEDCGCKGSLQNQVQHLLLLVVRWDQLDSQLDGHQRTGIAFNIALGGAAGWRTAGAKGAGKEFSHWIPNRMGGPRSKWNGNFMKPAEHYYTIPSGIHVGGAIWARSFPLGCSSSTGFQTSITAALSALRPARSE